MHKLSVAITSLLIILSCLLTTAKAQDNNPKYNAEIARGDEAFLTEEYEKAQKHYRKAMELNPKAKYPRYRLEDSRTLDEMKKARERKKDEEKVKNRDAAYKNAIMTGDREFKAKHYDVSKDAYLEALTIKHWEQYPKDQIEKINKILFQQNIDAAYRNAIDVADALFNAEEYYKARDEYKKALTIKPSEEYPKQRLNKIEEILNLHKQQAAYDKIIAIADKEYYSKKYQDAKNNYNKALKILDRQYPKDQIAKINDILAEQNADYAYQLAIEKADRQFNAQQYIEAKGTYQEASMMEPSERYPKDQIEKIELILASQNKLAEYNQIIAKADSYFEDERYTPAKNTYQEALNLIPNKQYPKDQIEKINQLLALQNKEIVYNSIIQKADAHFYSKEYAPSKNKYQEALKIIPEKQYPKDQIAKIEQILAGQNKDAAYNAAVEEADKLFGEKKYAPARSSYQTALNIYPEKMYPKNQIEKINLILAKLEKDIRYNNLIKQADNLFNEKTYSGAKIKYQEALTVKPNEQYPEDRISEIDRLLAAQDKQNLYNSRIAKADKFFGEKDYSPSKSAYQEALSIFPNKEYPQSQIAKIDDILAQLAKDSKYNQIISEADRLFTGKSYASSKGKYEEALTVKPNEQYPKDRIMEIDRLLAAQDKQNLYNSTIARADKLFGEKSYSPSKSTYQEALAIFPGKEYPQSQMAKIDEILAQLAKDSKYSQIIAEADKLFTGKSYASSKGKYEEALTVKPNEQYPKDRIIEIDRLLAAQDKQNLYNSTIAEADKLFGEKSYSPSKSTYQEALAIFPGKEYPQSQIVKIDEILAKLAMDSKYSQIIAEADKLFTGKSYASSKGKYEEALTVKPSEQYPKNKIAEIERLLKELDRQNQYNNLIEQADIQFKNKTYFDSKLNYQKALALFAEKAYPKEQISKIDAILAHQKKREQYQSLIQKADGEFGLKKYNAAKLNYNSALGILPNEQYPKKQIEKINQIIEAEARLDKYNGLIAEGDKLFNQESYDAAKENYQAASLLFPEKEYPKAQIHKIDQILAQILKRKKYDAFIAQADNLFDQKAYNDSKKKYQSALSVFTDKQYPKDRIGEIDKLLQQQAADKKYKETITQADGHFRSKKYKYALIAYKDALKIKPAEEYPQMQINKINAILNAPKTQIETPSIDIPVVEYEDFNLDLAKADSIEIEKAYKKAIDKGKSAHLEKYYSAARFYFSKAHEFKPDEKYPVEQLQLIKNEMKEILGSRHNKNYFDLLGRADRAFKDGYYSIAEYYYLFALSVKPSEQYPRTKLKEIQRIISEQEKDGEKGK